MERQIGEIFEFEGKNLKCVEDNEGLPCIGCIFFIEKIDLENYNCESRNMMCMSTERKDNKDVKFIEVKE